MFKFVVLLSFIACVLAGTIPSGMVPLSDHPAGRIVGGTPTTISSFPYQVSLLRYNSHTCGGAIYSSNIIVTAAHCLQSVSASALKIRAGSTYWASGGVSISVNTFRNHEKYSKSTYLNDIAVIKLSSSLTFGSTIRAVGLALSTPASGALATVSGWGTLTSGSSSLPDQLQYVDVTIIDRATCASRSYGYGSLVQTGMVCAAATGKDACQGDSGGPLVSDSVLVGVVSWGSGCALSNYPGVYTNVADYSTWVVSTSNSL